MPTTYTPLLGLSKPATGELSGTWGDTVNDYITTYLDSAIAGAQVISGSQTSVALSTANGTPLAQAGSGATGSAQYMIIRCTGNPAGMLTVTAPAASKAYLVLNQTSTSQSVKIVGAGPTTGITVAAGQASLVAWNGSDFTLVASNDISQLTGILPIASGGTGAITAAAARTNLGGTTVGSNLFTLANPSAVTFPRFNADNTVSALNAADFRTAIGASSTTGTVTSVSGTGTVNGITLTGTVTSTGSLTLGGTLSGVNLTTQVTGTLPVGNGGTGQTTYTNGELLIGNTTGNTLTKATLTAGSNITITNGPGSITIASTNTGGTVTSITAGTGLTGGTITTSGTIAIDSTVTTLTGTQTLTNKRINPRVTSTATATALTPDISQFDQYNVTALATGLTINAPTGTPVDGNKIVFRLLDNGTARALTWDVTYTAIGVTLPTTTTANKTTYVGCIYNANNTRWDVVAVTTQA